MRAYNVLVWDVTYRNYPVIANNEEEASEKVLEGDHEGCFLVDGGEWEIVSVDKAQE